MRVRALDSDGDWTFGKGKGNYKTGNQAVAQNINSRLLCFYEDCFFDLDAGLDWYNLLGSKDQIGLRLAISAAILNIPEVTGLKQLSITLDRVTRAMNIRYEVQTAYSTLTSQTQFTQGL